MTELLINAVAARGTSLGVKRYFQGVVDRLDWVGATQLYGPSPGRGTRLKELLMPGRKDAILWSPSHRGPLFAHNHVVTVHDCINIEYTYRNDWRRPLLRAALSRLLQNAVMIAANSNATRAAVLRHFDLDPDKVVAIPGPAWFPERAHAEHEPIAPGNFVLMICNALPHKNTALAGAAFARSSAAQRQIALYVVGDMAAAGLSACRNAGVMVQQFKGISDADLDRLIRDCRFLWSPSLEEGIDLPVAEALSAGANVLASDIPAHREFYDGEVAFFDPASLDAAVEALEQAFMREGVWPRAKKQKAEWSFDQVAQSYRHLFQQVAHSLDYSEKTR